MFYFLFFYFHLRINTHHGISIAHTDYRRNCILQISVNFSVYLKLVFCSLLCWKWFFPCNWCKRCSFFLGLASQMQFLTIFSWIVSIWTCFVAVWRIPLHEYQFLIRFSNLRNKQSYFIKSRSFPIFPIIWVSTPESVSRIFTFRACSS